MARSIRSLAVMVGKCASTVRRWVRRRDWPFSLVPPWPAEAVRGWAIAHVRRDPAAEYRERAAAEAGKGEFRETGLLTLARTKKTAEQARREQIKRLAEEGKVHDAEECRELRLRQIHEVRGRLSELPRSLSLTLANQPAEAVEHLLGQAINAILDDYGQDRTS
jgi:phage terminase Nu1 subunit (DNA packaging protein)